MRELFQLFIDWVIDHIPSIIVIGLVTGMLLVAMLTTGCQLKVGANIGITKTAEQSSTETTKTTVTSNPEGETDEDY